MQIVFDKQDEGHYEVRVVEYHERTERTTWVCDLELREDEDTGTPLWHAEPAFAADGFATFEAARLAIIDIVWGAIRRGLDAMQSEVSQ